MQPNSIYRKKLIRIVVLLALVLATSCEKEISWKLQQSTVQTLVVDGILTNEMKQQCIRLSLVNSEINQPMLALSGASVTVTDGSSVYNFTELSGNAGSYYSLPFQAVAGKTYKLKIEYQSAIFEASADMVPLTPAGAIKYSLDSGKQLYKYEPEDPSDPVMTEINLDWSKDAAYTNSYGSSKAKMYYYKLKDIDANKIFAPDKENIYFPIGTKIIRRQYSLTEEHQAFLRSLLMETEWRGGIFDVQPGNVSTNISNGGLGFFAVCTTKVDSTVVGN